MVRSVNRAESLPTCVKMMMRATKHMPQPRTYAEPPAIFPDGIGRCAVRPIRPSVSLSIHWLSAATPPAASEAPTARNATRAGSCAGRAAK